MTELMLYRYIEKEKLEIDWRGDELILWLDYYSAREFAEMIHLYLSDGGANVNMQQSCIAFDIVPICEFYDIEPENVHAKDNDIEPGYETMIYY